MEVGTIKPNSKIAGILAYLTREKVADDIVITAATIQEMLREVKASRVEYVYDLLRTLEVRGFITRKKVSTGGFIIKLVPQVPVSAEGASSEEVVSEQTETESTTKATSPRKTRSSRKKSVSSEKKSKPQGKTLDQEIADIEKEMFPLREKLVLLGNIHKKLVDARNALKEK